MRVLGIETSCDETAVAVVARGRRARADGDILSNVDLQPDRRAPRLTAASCRRSPRAPMSSVSIPLVRRALAEAGVGLGDLDGIAATARARA